MWKQDNLLKRFNESLPIEDRDDYASWKADFEKKNSVEYKRAQRNEILYRRNSPLIDRWVEVFNTINKEVGLYRYRTDRTKRIPSQFSFNCAYTVGADSDPENADSISLGLYLSYPENEDHEICDGKLENVIKEIKKYKGLCIDVCAFFGISSDNENLINSSSKESYINAHIKTLLDEDLTSRKKAGEIKKFLKKCSDDDFSDFHGYYDAITFMDGTYDGSFIKLRYKMSINPTDEEVRNVIDGLKTFRNVMPYLGFLN